MMKHLLIVCLCILLLAVSGCSNGTSEASNTNTNTGTSDNQEQSAPSDQTPTEQPTTTTSNDDKLGFLEEIMQKKSAASYKVTYDMATVAGGHTVGGTMAQYVKGNKFRVDATVQGIESRSYVIGNEGHACTNVGGSWTCASSNYDESENPTAAIEKDFANGVDPNMVSYAGTKSIAGTTAQCYAIRTVEGYSAEYCVSPEGVPVYVKSSGTAGGSSFSSELKATSYSTRVSDSDFELPSGASDISGGVGGAGGASDYCALCNNIPDANARQQCLSSC